MGQNIRGFYKSYLKVLEKGKKEITYLQLTGRIEDYLTRSFMVHIFDKSKRKLVPMYNLGNKKQRKYDISILKGNFDDPIIMDFIEAKYLHNRHKYWKSDAGDESRSALVKFSKQLKPFHKHKHSKFRVRPGARVYGIIFISYVEDVKNGKSRKEFIRKQKQIARECGFSHQGLKTIYKEEKVNLFDKVLYVTLLVGFWKK